MKFAKPLILFILLGVLVSCKKEEIRPISPAELLIKDIQSVMTSHNVDHIFCTEKDVNFETQVSVFGGYGADYEFFGQSLYWEGDYYNMNQLEEYSIHNKNGVYYMVLYF